MGADKTDYGSKAVACRIAHITEYRCLEVHRGDPIEIPDINGDGQAEKLRRYSVTGEKIGMNMRSRLQVDKKKALHENPEYLDYFKKLEEKPNPILKRLLEGRKMKTEVSIFWTLQSGENDELRSFPLTEATFPDGNLEIGDTVQLKDRKAEQKMVGSQLRLSKQLMGDAKFKVIEPGTYKVDGIWESIDKSSPEGQPRFVYSLSLTMVEPPRIQKEFVFRGEPRHFKMKPYKVSDCSLPPVYCELAQSLDFSLGAVQNLSEDLLKVPDAKATEAK